MAIKPYIIKTSILGAKLLEETFSEEVKRQLEDDKNKRDNKGKAI